jgi:ketosteroid isomerase-like protein
VSAVERYLAALPAHDWATVRACLAPAVVRIGPYNDVYRGRDQYAQFLAETVEALPGYEMDVERVVHHDGSALVELSETIDEPDGSRLRTAEAIVFDLDGDGLITRVAVYLRASTRH